jgi:HD superfamily phosphohydrolase
MSKFVQEWMPNDEKLIPFYKGIDEFLKEYLDNLQPEDTESHQPKIIADPLLGYVHLTKLEMAIIDTKLYQRLRKIRQLGLAHLVFPSLSYSRFEHSLGVLGRLNQVINKLIENNLRINPDDNISNVVEKYIIPLRLAALLHDVGHCLYSHCSERIIEKIEGTEIYPSANFIKEIFQNHFNKDKIPFAELFAVCFIGSVRFYDFIETVGEFQKNKIKKELECCARFILGLPLPGDPATVFMAQLISGGLDADKIDYMIREQLYSGIKLEIDLDRILSKLQVFDLKLFELPKNLVHIKKLYDAEKICKVLGFGKGGQFAFEEFCVARLALHVKVYLHQKVRAAESQLSKYLEVLSKSPVFLEVHNWLRLPELIVEHPELIERDLNRNRDLFNSIQTDYLKSTNFRKIDNREIYVRAFALGQINSFSEPIENGDVEKDVGKILTNFFDSFKNLDLREKIYGETLKITNKLGVSVGTEQIEDILIDFPRLINIQQGQESLHFQRSMLTPVKWTIPIDKIVVYFQENRALAYIFSPREIAHFVSLASEKVVFDLTSKVFNQEDNISKSTFYKTYEFKKQLTNLGYYDKYPQLKLISDYLKKAEAIEKIRLIYENLAVFKSLNNNDRITINRITTFVNQFPENLQDVCLSFLEQLKIYNENILEEELKKAIDKIILKTSKIGITYLGGAADSGARFNYYVRNVLEKYHLENPKEISDSLILDSETLVLYDDNINSGLQLLNIFAELLDEKDKLGKKDRLEEKHVSPLATNEAKQKLKDVPIYIIYIVGTSGVERKIKKLLSESLGFKKENINISIYKEFSEEEKIFTGRDSNFNHDKKKELRDFLVETGKKLLKAEGKKDEKIESCNLGYANAEAMVVFPYNIPTMTITALWCNGVVDGIPWIPLAERRRRSKNGVFIGED